MRGLRRRGTWWRCGLPLLGGCALALLAGAGNVLSAGSAAQKPTTVTEQCVNETCHGGIVNHAVMHGPVAQKKCQACHKYEDPREHRFKRLAEPDQGCTQCHDMKHKTVVHAARQRAAAPSAMILTARPTKECWWASPTQGLCLSCHKPEDYSKKKFVHGPVSSGACTVCHEAHSAAQPKLLKDSSRNLCISCHKEMVPKPGEDRSIHAPVRDNCMACHDPHASNLKYELKQAAPNLCLSCHKNLKESLATSPVVHGADDAGGRLLELPRLAFFQTAETAETAPARGVPELP